jgi:hypothetical protein
MTMPIDTVLREKSIWEHFFCIGAAGTTKFLMELICIA